MAGLWLLRHGSLPPNPERRFVGARDIALTAAGREQIRQAARALLTECGAANGLPPSVAAATGQGRHAWTAVAEAAERGALREGESGRYGPFLPRYIICSDLGRCRESARLVQEVFHARGHAIDIFPDAGLREISLGLWEGLTVAEVESRWPGSHAARGADMAGFAPPQGESFAAVQARAVACVERWQARYPDECLLLVSHAGVLRTLLCHWLALPLAEVMRIPQHYACRIWLPGQDIGESTPL
ncbi:histidine phosphatase family protein [Desulfovibrio piger]|uniref:histidine phosphatase family protein n=1 Tax=Desulfovibrio piger TaxID=901 RepID=UPI0026F34F5B|nr:histidine phosphatase family protein [Desulfovibrio piger]